MKWWAKRGLEQGKVTVLFVRTEEWNRGRGAACYWKIHHTCQSVVQQKQCYYWLSGMTAVMMRGVLFDCHALRVPCAAYAMRCVALCCAALRGDEPAEQERRALSPPSSPAHHHSISKLLCDTRRGQLTKYMQQGNKYVRHNPHCLSFEHPYMSTTLIVYCSCYHQPNRKNSMQVILKSYTVFILSLFVFAVCDSIHPASPLYDQHRHIIICCLLITILIVSLQ